MYTLHANLMESRPLAAPVSTLHDYQPSADYPSKQQPLESAIARPSSLSLSSSASVPLNSPNVKAADAEAPPFAVAPTAVVHHSTSTFNATKLAPGAVTTRDSSWSGTYKCYDYGETFAASFLCHVDAFKGKEWGRSQQFFAKRIFCFSACTSASTDAVLLFCAICSASFLKCSSTYFTLILSTCVHSCSSRHCFGTRYEKVSVSAEIPPRCTRLPLHHLDSAASQDCGRVGLFRGALERV